MLDPVVGVAFGLAKDASFEEGTKTLKPGETMVICSDGVTGAENDSGEKFGIERLKHVFEGNAPNGAREAADRIMQAANEFARGLAQSDDVTCLAIRRR